MKEGNKMATALAKEDMASLYDSLVGDKKARTVSFGISDQYIPKWTELESLKEYIANFYDENGADFRIYSTERAVVLEDSSKRGILLEDLAFGNSRSAEASYKIGTHGEGFKLGALALARQGRRVLIDTVGNTIAFFLENDKELGSKILKAKIAPNARKLGTTCYLETDKLKEAKEQFLFLSEDAEKISELLYRSKSGKGSVFVNTLAAQSVESRLSYALYKKQKVNRDRNLLESPYHDVALELLSSKNELEIEAFLSAVMESSDRSYERELLRYLYANNRKKEFKNIDYSLFKRVAERMKIGAFQQEGETERKKIRYFNPGRAFFFARDYAAQWFLGKTLERAVYADGLNFAAKKGEKWSAPVANSAASSLQSACKELSESLKGLALLKSFKKEGRLISFALKGVDKINIAAGEKSAKTRSADRWKLSRILAAAQSLSKFGEIRGWDIAFSDSNGFCVAAFSKLPEAFGLWLSKEEEAEELEGNVLFSGAKTIAKDLVFLLDGSQHLFEDGQKGEPIRALFSYDKKCAEGKSARAVFESKQVAKAMLERVSEPEAMAFELKLMDSLLAEISRYSYRDDDLKKVWKEQFKDVFGRKALASSEPQADKKAAYYGYKVIKMPSQLETLFSKLEICLSSEAQGTESQAEGIVPRPELEWESWKDSEYRDIAEAAMILNRTLEDAFEIAEAHASDARCAALRKLLPEHRHESRRNPLAKEYRLTVSNAKRAIRDYCFELIGRTHVAARLGESDIGLYKPDGTILLLSGLVNLGTFMHEHVHMATGLKDIDAEFEKTLSLVGILAKKHQSAATDKSVKAYFESYRKWHK